jgi:hypothetical protein
MDSTALLAPWLSALTQRVPDLELFDAHTHLGEHDPDGMRQSPDELIGELLAAHARGCFVFPMHEPDGYPPANDMVLAAAAESNGLMVPFCRVKPGEPDRGALREAERSLANGARGIKLHPRAEQFTLDHPDVPELFALANERRLPILIHAGRGIPALGEHVLSYAARFPDARVILAHAGVTDLAWIWRVVADTPNVLFDTAWWMPSDLIALFTLVPPGQIVFASDAPYGSTLTSAVCHLRLALQAGLSAEQLTLIASGQAVRVAAGEPLAVAGPAVGERERAGHVLLDRVADLLQIGTMIQYRFGSGEELFALARLACEVPDEIDDAPVFAAIRALLNAYDEATAADPEDRRNRVLLMLATAVARTPDVPLPAVEIPDQT